ncbi:hypothetical protein FRC11_014600, partial [Ceratobasidium sp. 423]
MSDGLITQPTNVQFPPPLETMLFRINGYEQSPPTAALEPKELATTSPERPAKVHLASRPRARPSVEYSNWTQSVFELSLAHWANEAHSQL